MTASFRFYAELNDFLPPEKRHVSFTCVFSGHQTVKDLIEAQGVPHGEVDVILINGESVDFSARLKPGDRVSIYPVFESIDVKGIVRVRPEPLREIKFLLDVPLGRLASHLRLFGFDSVYYRDGKDAELVRMAQEQRRILLTRDKRLLMRKSVTHGCFVRAVQPSHQLVEVIRRFDLIRLVAVFDRCLRCNGKLYAVEKKVVDRYLEPKTRIYFEEFSRCESCGRVYWRGSHYEKIHRFVQTILLEVTRHSESF